MATQRAIPPLLQTYLELPPELSTIVVTSVLGASHNWLLERYIIGALSVPSNGIDTTRQTISASRDHAGGENGLAVVLVSWFREFETWKLEVRRASGLDLSKQTTQGRFAFIDALSELPDIGAVFTAVRDGVERLRAERRVLLVLDQPDVALAITSTPAAVASLSDLLAGITALCGLANATVISLSADSPLVAPAAAALNLGEGTTPPAFAPLASQHAALVTSLVHRARYVLQLRKLETGWASDVSGILRICQGGAWDDDEIYGEAAAVREAEQELLYYVKGDGSVKVFERGAYGSG